MIEARPFTGWRRHPNAPEALAHIASPNKSAWLSPSGRIAVLSSADDGEYHVSISTDEGRATDQQVKEVLAAFGMVGAVEFNRSSVVRHYFRRSV